MIDDAPYGDPMPRPVSVLRPMPTARVAVRVHESSGPPPAGSGLLLDLTAADVDQADADTPAQAAWELAHRALTQALILLTSPLLSWTGETLHIHLLVRAGTGHGRALRDALADELTRRGYPVDVDTAEPVTA